MQLNEALCAKYLLPDSAFWQQAQHAFAAAQAAAGTALFTGAAHTLLEEKDTAQTVLPCEAMLRMEPGGMVLAAFLGACLPTALQKLSARGIADCILQDTFADFSRWAAYYKEQHGTPGIGEIPWVLYPYAGKIFALGRLMFEPAVFSHPYFVYKKDGLCIVPQAEHNEAKMLQNGYVPVLRQGDAALSVHIPAGAPLTPQQVDASLQYAASFFAGQKQHFACAFCDSWMLDAALEKICAPQSNLLAFAHRFLRYEIDEGASFGKYVFGPAFNGDTLHCSAQNSLQRAVQGYLMQGGAMHDMGGVMEFCPRVEQ